MPRRDRPQVPARATLPAAVLKLGLRVVRSAQRPCAGDRSNHTSCGASGSYAAFTGIGRKDDPRSRPLSRRLDFPLADIDPPRQNTHQHGRFMTSGGSELVEGARGCVAQAGGEGINEHGRMMNEKPLASDNQGEPIGAVLSRSGTPSPRMVRQADPHSSSFLGGRGASRLARPVAGD